MDLLNIWQFNEYNETNFESSYIQSDLKIIQDTLVLNKYLMCGVDGYSIHLASTHPPILLIIVLIDS
jgi:hypothetical protein